jgi:ADP-ribose pyrophosphatase YjhB (NUDIX family)
MKNRIVVTALVKKDDKYVFIKKKGEDIYHLPGGAIEENEDIYKALKREIKEECCLEIKDIEPVDFVVIKGNHDGVDSQSIYLRFTASYLKGELKIGEETSEVVVLTSNEIVRTNQNPHTIEFLKKLGILNLM